MQLSLRHKLFVALASAAVLGGSGGLAAVVTLGDLARRHRQEQELVAAHARIHASRIRLLLLSRAVHQALWADPLGLEGIDEAWRLVDESLATCGGCHERDVARGAPAAPAAPRGGRALLERRAMGDAMAIWQAASRSAEPGDRKRAAARIEVAAIDLESRLATLEDEHHKARDLRRLEGREPVVPSFGQHLLLVLAGLAVAFAAAWVAARAMTRPVLRLIDSARRLVGGDRAAAAELPRDPELAEVARALNDLAGGVADQAREETRRQLLERLISTQEEERKRVARELHDELGQSLSALLMYVRSHPTGPSSREAVEEIEKRLQGAIEELRRMAWDLRPSLLDDHGLGSALSRLVEDLSQRSGLQIDFQAAGLEGEARRLPGSIETVIFRVAQEALNNAVRHARAGRASVVLVRRDDTVTLVVEDDGVGFEHGQRPQKRPALGLLGMQERVALTGGALTVESEPGRGTTVRARIPVVAGASDDEQRRGDRPEKETSA